MFPVTITIHNAADLVKVMTALGATSVAFEESSKAPQPETKVTKSKKTEASAEGNAPTGTPAGSDVPPVQEASAPPASDAPAATPAIKYDDLKAAVFKLAGKSRDAAIAMNKQFGVTTMKELDAARWPEALAAVNAKLAELGG